MNSSYCQKCGQPNYYTTTKPSYCCSCASPFGSNPPLKAKVRPKPKVIEQEIEEDEEEIEDNVEIPTINKLKYKIESSDSRGLKFKDVAYSGGTGGISRKPTNYTLEDFRREASNSKNSVIPEDLGEND